MHGIFELLPIAAFSKKKKSGMFWSLNNQTEKIQHQGKCQCSVSESTRLKKKSINQFPLLCCYALPASNLNVVLGRRLEVL